MCIIKKTNKLKSFHSCFCSAKKIKKIIIHYLREKKKYYTLLYLRGKKIIHTTKKYIYMFVFI